MPIAGRNISRELWYVSIDGPVNVALIFKGGGGRSSSSSNNNEDDDDKDNKRHIAFRCNFEDLVTWKFIYCKYTFTVIGENQQMKTPRIVNSTADRSNKRKRYCTTVSDH